MTSKAVAIAIVAMVAIPIGLGFILAFEDVEREGWRTVEAHNLSDSILNSRAPYYISSTSPNNNSMMLPSVTYSTVTSPDYDSVSSVSSGIPIYDYDDSSISPQVGESVTHNAERLVFSSEGFSPEGGTSSGEVSGASFRITGTNIDVTNGGVPMGGYDSIIYVMRVTSGDNVLWMPFDSSGDPMLSNPIANLILRSHGGGAMSYSVSMDSYSEISGDMWSLTNSGLSSVVSVQIVHFDGTMDYVALPYDAVFVRAGSTVVYGGGFYDEVSSVSVAVYGAAITLSSRGSPTGEYADPSMGWTLPQTMVGSYSGTWINGTSNSSVILYVTPYFDVGELYLYLTDQNGGTDTLYLSQSSTTLNGVSFDWPGNILSGRPIQIVITTDTIRISNIQAWPSMYSEPVRYGSIELEREHPAPITSIGLTNVTTEPFTFRVDTTESFAGYYPITRDATLDIADLFGTGGFSLDFSSAGIYGEALEVGGVSYPVTDGKISVDGTDYRVRGLVIGITPDDAGYAISFNGTEISAVEAYPTIGFLGEWSVSIRGWTMEEFTEISKEWIPGEFALELSDLGIVGLISCVGVFIGAAMMRPLSGSKILMLLIVCGIGGLIFLSLI